MDVKAGSGLARVLTGRRSAWVVLALFLVVVAGLSIGLGRLDTAPRGANLPATAESKLAADALKQFPGSDRSAVLVVAHRADGAQLSPQQVGEFARLAAQLSGTTKPAVIPSEDGAAVIALVPVPASDSASDNLDEVTTLRAAIAAQAPADLTVLVSGGPAFGADIADSFSGADVTLLLVTVGIVAVLLLATYRSPVLWLVPLTVVGLADQAATQLTNALSLASGWHAEGGVVSVLVFGAGTNYALLLISRYREELVRHADHRDALRVAWRGSLGAILASNLTVVIGLLTLLFAVLPDTRGLGLASAAGLLLAMLSVVVVLPAALAVVGRGAFWPFIPRALQGAGTADAEDRPGVWGRIASAVVSHPVRSLLGGLALLAVLASGLFGVRVGLDQADQFRLKAESVDGLGVIAQHYPAGSAAPIQVIVPTAELDAVTASLRGVPGVTSVTPTLTDAARGRSALQVVGQPAPGTQQALDLVQSLRDVLGEGGHPDALVGGAIAQDLDQRAAQQRDFLVIAPLVLLVSLVVLFVLTRAVVTPVLLLVVNVVSAAAAVGAGWMLSQWIMGSPALAIEVPLYAFIFLVALGIDYSIFLIERIRHESSTHGTRRGTIEAVRHTGAVITSAGIVLAAVFAALGVLPLVVMGQLGIIVCVGVLVDTLVVRTVIVPALFGLLGDRMWWPRRAA
ncbi:MMPL family transporter [Propionibacteriaceae bacterium G57]|uniref:MMPL family transporter n=1 Tax=Aestuariimicrobium sp. G57 TaxID=3418485 RepID=UPI003DA6F957